MIIHVMMYTQKVNEKEKIVTNTNINRRVLEFIFRDLATAPQIPAIRQSLRLR